MQILACLAVTVCLLMVVSLITLAASSAIGVSPAAALTSSKPIAPLEGGLENRPVLGGVKIFSGAMIGITAAGFARPFAVGDTFGGHAYATCDNTNGGDGDARVHCKRGQYWLEETLAGVTEDNIGDPLHALDDEQLALAGGTAVGWVENVTPETNTIIAGFKVFG